MNAILLIIDSLAYSRCQQSEIDLLPNLNRRAKSGIKCENMYSQAPYTEAASMALYCGQRTLSNHGYIERFNNADKTIMETFKESGYDVYFNSFQPQCFPSSLRRGVDYIYYNRGFDAIALWNYRFEYFSDKAEKKGLSTDDYIQLIRILDDNYSEWIKFLEDIISNDESVKLIRNLNLEYPAKTVLQDVLKQKALYESNQEEFINEIVKMKEKHPLFQIAYFEQVDYSISAETEGIYAKDVKKFCKKIRKLNAVENILFNQDIYTGFLKSVSAYLKNHNKKELKHRLYIIRNALIMCNHMKKFGTQCHSLKGQPSFNTHIKGFLDWVDNRSSNKPYFACIHVDDIHFPEMFFTYDTDEQNVIKNELNNAENYLKQRRFNSKGTISLDLSLLYADLKCEYLFQELKSRNMMEDTFIFVTADHGFSYSGYPIRNKLINTFYLENFKIPFYIFGRDLKEKRIVKLCSSLDIPPTICKLMKVNVPSSFEGSSVFSTDEEIQMIEYCGGGCPDINSRELMIAAFDQHYMVASLVKLYEKFSDRNITEIYNLKDDPEQRKNIIFKIDLKKVRRYIEVIQDRLIQIQKTNMDCMIRILKE